MQQCVDDIYQWLVENVPGKGKTKVEGYIEVTKGRSISKLRIDYVFKKSRIK